MQIMWSQVMSSHRDLMTKALQFDEAGTMIIGVLSSY